MTSWWSVSLALLWLFGASLAPPSRAQDFEIALALGQSLSDAGRATVQGRIETANFSARLAAARERYWRTWPDKQGHRQASAELASLLWQKDFIYLTAFLAEGPPPPSGFDRAPLFSDIVSGRVDRLPPDLKLGELLFRTVFGEIDEGIPAHLQGRFYEWVMQVRRGLGARGQDDLLLVNPLRIPEALAGAQQAYDVYVAARDNHELFMGQYSPLGTSNPREFLIAALMRGRSLSREAASRQVASLESFIGPALLEGVFAALLLPEEDPRSVSAESFSHRLALGLFRRLREQQAPDARSWLAIAFMPSDFSGLPRSMAFVRELIETHGEARVLAAADRLKHIRMGDYGRLAVYSGHKPESARWWLEQVLERPEMPVPTITEPLVLDIADTALLQEVADRGIAVRVVGTVQRARWDVGGGPDTSWLHLYTGSAGESRFVVQGIHQDVLYKVTGQRGEKAIGKRLAAFDTPSVRGDTVVVEIRGADNVQVVDDSLVALRALPERLASRAGEPWPGAAPQ